jgi:hypothetical protein
MRYALTRGLTSILRGIIAKVHPHDKRKEEIMKRPLMVVLFVAAVAAGAMTPGTVSAEPANSVNLGIGGVVQILPHCKANVAIVEYEHMLGPKIAVLGRGSGVDYKFDDGRYREVGRPRGVDLGARFYPAGGLKGFFLGGTLGYWMANWTFTQNKGMSDEFQGKGKTDSIRANVDIGARFPIGSSSVSIMPALNIGKFFSSTSCEYTAPASRVGTSCSQNTEVKYYAFLAVTAGIGF